MLWFFATACFTPFDQADSLKKSAVESTSSPQVLYGSDTPLAWRVPTAWTSRVRLAERGRRPLGPVEYVVADVEFRMGDGAGHWVPGLRFFVAENRLHAPLTEWFEYYLPGSMSFFRVDDVPVHASMHGLHLVWTASVRATQPLNFPFPDMLALEDTAHTWVLFPTLLGDHHVLAEFSIDEVNLDPIWWSGITLDGSPPPEPITHILGFGETCGQGFGEEFGMFRLTSMYSNGDCTGFGRGHYTAIEFLRRVYSTIPWEGVVEDFFSRATEWNLQAFPIRGSERPRAGDILIFTGGREGHAAVVKHVACFASRTCRLTIMEQNWWGDVAGVGRLLTFGEREGTIVAMELDSGSHYVVGWLRVVDANPATDDDGDGFVTDDCDDTDPVTHPRVQESCEGTCEIGTGSFAACNGVDDNCDGATDEEFVALLNTDCLRPGCDARGVTLCDPSGRGRVCVVDPSHVTLEVCDTVDNDCDGATDEGCVPEGTCTACINNQQCAAGFRCISRGGRRHSYCLPRCAQARPTCPPGFFCIDQHIISTDLPTWYCVPVRECAPADFP